LANRYISGLWRIWDYFEVILLDFKVFIVAVGATLMAFFVKYREEILFTVVGYLEEHLLKAYQKLKRRSQIYFFVYFILDGFSNIINIFLLISRQLFLDFLLYLS